MANKTCKCGTQCGPRTRVCPKCGHEFIRAVEAGSQTMEPIKISSPKAEKPPVKPSITQFEPPSSLTPVKYTESDAHIAREATKSGKTIIPAGKCPIKPEGYKASGENNWPDGKPNPEIIAEWARNVYDSGNYTPDAVKYWAREFWDINGPEFRTIKQIIDDALSIYLT